MDPLRPPTMGYGLGWPRVDSRDLVIKVKYGDTLKRFNACVSGSHFDHDLPSLRLKIASAFKFSPDAEFILTYTDEDGDVVMLDDDGDLRDAAIKQKLNPLRINVHLKSSNVGATRIKQQAINSKFPKPTSLEDQLAQVKSAIDEALKFVPEQVPAVLAKLSHDLRSRAASSAPSLAELLDRFAKLISRSSHMHPPCDSADGSRKWGNSKVKRQSATMIGSASEPLGVQNSGKTEAGLKSVLLSEDPSAKIEQSQLRPLVDDSLIFTSPGGMQTDLKRSVDTELKIKSDARGKGKSVISSVPTVSTTSHGAPTPRSVPVPYVPNPTNTSFRSNGMANGDMLSLFPPPPVVYPSPTVLPCYNNIFPGANGKTTGDLHSTFPPPPNIPFKLNTPSSVGTGFPNLLSTRSSHTDPMAPLFSDYVPYPDVNYFESSYKGHGANYGSIQQHAQHRWIQCDECGVTPIVGPRYKSNVKQDYDLCGACFSHMGNDSEYTRLDRPASKSNMSGRIPALKTDCHFIKDVTIPDGTPMSPSTPFTKIWRIRNNGSTMWPYGTHLVWVGGDQLACTNSARLVISACWGLNPLEETDVAVEFLAPAEPGRYISYWRLTLPSGVKFGQPIWVDIQVEQPIQTSGNKQAAAINLNQLPKANSTRPFTFGINSAPVEPLPLRGWPRSIAPLEPLFGCSRSSCADWLPLKTMKPKESETAPNDMSSPVAVEPVQIAVTDAPASSAQAALASMPTGVLAPEASPLPNPVPMPAGPVSASVPVPAAAPVPEEIVNHLEEKLMSELEVLGFLQADLNKQILRQNNYDLEQSVVDLCGFNEWDPLLEEFSELGSDDAEMNKEEVVDNSDDEGFIVADLVTKVKKDQ